MNLQVLLVEDDIDLAASIGEYLALKGISVKHADNGLDGLNLASKHSYDAILLDLMLPQIDGLTLCRHLRSQGIGTPVMMLTARDTLDDKLEGFNAGGDDYLTKPFALEELCIRIQALAKWHSGQMQKIQIGDLILNLDQRIAKRGERTQSSHPVASQS